MRDCFFAFFERFSKEIDHLSLADFFALQNFSGKIWSFEFTASSSKSLEGFRKGLRKGSNRKIVSQVEAYLRIMSYFISGSANIHFYSDVKGAPIFQNTLFRGVQTFIIILMCRVYKYFRILYLGWCPK